MFTMNHFLETEVHGGKLMLELPETIYIPECSFVHENHLGRNSCTFDWSHSLDRAYKYHC
jgi:hypothetical protein